jgi:ADP-heptose:LPS heptosyltransferase
MIIKHIKALFYSAFFVLPIIIYYKKRPVIFSKWSGIGDIICTMPAALELAKKHSGSPLIFNCYEEFSCIPRLAGLTTRTTNFQEIGLIGYWYHWMLAGFYQFSSADDNPKIMPKDVYIKDFGRRFGLEISDDHPILKSDPEMIAAMRQRLLDIKVMESPLIVIHTGPSWPVREWPEVSWNHFVKQLHQKGYKPIIQIGTSAHALTPGATKAGIIKGAHSMVDQLSLEETIALISLSDLFIGIDSGMLHIAASVGTASVGIWGPTSPQFRFAEKNRKYHITSSITCQGCQHRVPRLHWISSCPHNILCMKLITAEKVLVKVKEAFSTS